MFRGDFIIGADGSFSKVRSLMNKGLMVDYSQKFLDYRYKEFFLDSNTVSRLKLDVKGVHTWGDSRGFILGLPNADGSISLNLILKESLTNNRDYKLEFLKYLSETLYGLNEFNKVYLEKALKKVLLDDSQWNGIVTIKTSNWTFQDKVVLVGDSCHSIVHFFAQGMNASLEDCYELIESIKKFSNRQEAFENYENVRKDDLEVLSQLSYENFLVLLSKSKGCFYNARWNTNSWLSNKTSFWKNPYSLVVDSRTSYRKVKEISNRQEIYRKYFGIWLIDIFFVVYGFTKSLFSPKRSREIKNTHNFYKKGLVND